MKDGPTFKNSDACDPPHIVGDNSGDVVVVEEGEALLPLSLDLWSWNLRFQRPSVFSHMVPYRILQPQLLPRLLTRLQRPPAPTRAGAAMDLNLAPVLIR